MASAKPATTTRRASPSRSPRRSGEEQEVSPARWGGVAFVIVAIVAAIVLGVFSPSEPATSPGAVAVGPSPTPSPSTLDTRVPTAKPRITHPQEGTTNEIDISVKVAVPEDELRRGELTLFILRGDEELKRLERPKPGSTIEVKGVRLVPGPNELTAVLRGPGEGWGPRSEPLLLSVDRDKADLAITSPQNKASVYEDTARIEGTSEVGAEVLVENETTERGTPVTVGPSGEFAVTVRLKKGPNTITATARDEADIPNTATVKVTRLDGKPRIKIRPIDPIKRAQLPTEIEVVVEVTDAKGKPIADAQVDYQLGAPDRTAVTDPGTTNAKGRSRWPVRVEPSSSTADALQLSVTVTSPLSGQKATATQSIDFR